ncbi:hypothetical protein F5Y01DRAFT_323986 [Xylaria sp. FL0043]|nr:hypothetical protein F5Y01DRAFT_323986 [Xylaria sp. FL0043]
MSQRTATPNTFLSQPVSKTERDAFPLGLLVFTFMFVRSRPLCIASLIAPVSRSNLALTRDILNQSNNSAILTMENHPDSTSSASQQSVSLSAVFENAEANFPSRFRKHGWYLTVQKLSGKLYAHLVAQPQYQTSAQRQALIRRLREAMVKCIILNGIPSVIEAVSAIAECERPEDQDHSCSREDWHIGEANTKRAGETLKVLYKSEEGGVTKTLTAHRDIPWISKNISYGLFLSDHRILDIQETELVTLAATMAQNLLQPTYWHPRACLRVGMEPEEVEAVHKVIESVTAYGGKKLDVQHVADITDV